MEYKGLHNQRRKILATILGAEKGIITIDLVEKILGWDRPKVRALLYSLKRAGWIKSIKKGVYIPVPLESDDPDLVNINPLILANSLYKECYIGGWSAASFWGLTDQIFRKTWVFTKKLLRYKEETRGTHIYCLKHVSSGYFYGLYTEWMGQDKIFISDPHKTVIDFANFIDEYGMQSFIDVFSEYMKSDHKDLKMLLEYADKSKNQTIFKRLGFILEKFSPQETSAIETCLKKVKPGATFFAPREKCESFSNKWRLWIPKSLNHDS